MKKTIIVAFSLLVCLCIMSGCNDNGKTISQDVLKNDLEYTRGIINENTFESQWAGIKCTIPENMKFLSDKELAETVGLATDLIYNENQELVLDYINMTTVYEFYAVDITSGQVLFMTTEKLPTAMTEDEYSQALRNQFDMIEMDIEYTTEVLEEVKYGGITFKKFDVVIPFSESIYIAQTYLIKSIGDRMICLCATSTDSNITDAILDGISSY